MKFCVFAILVVCSVLAVVTCEETCEQQKDCPKDECCVFFHVFMSSKCKKLRRKGFFCFPDSELLINDGKYRLVCPCEPGLKCEAESTKVENGVITYHNSTCQEAKSKY